MAKLIECQTPLNNVIPTRSGGICFFLNSFGIHKINLFYPTRNFCSDY